MIANGPPGNSCGATHLDRPAGGALQVGRQLQEETKRDPDRFAPLGIGLPDQLAAVYGEHILLGLRTPTQRRLSSSSTSPAGFMGMVGDARSGGVGKKQFFIPSDSANLRDAPSVTLGHPQAPEAESGDAVPGTCHCLPAPKLLECVTAIRAETLHWRSPLYDLVATLALVQRYREPFP